MSIHIYVCAYEVERNNSQSMESIVLYIAHARAAMEQPSKQSCRTMYDVTMREHLTTQLHLDWHEHGGGSVVATYNSAHLDDSMHETVRCCNMSCSRCGEVFAFRALWLLLLLLLPPVRMRILASPWYMDAPVSRSGHTKQHWPVTVSIMTTDTNNSIVCIMCVQVDTRDLTNVIFSVRSVSMYVCVSPQPAFSAKMGNADKSNHLQFTLTWQVYLFLPIYTPPLPPHLFCGCGQCDCTSNINRWWNNIKWTPFHCHRHKRHPRFCL